MSGAPTYLHHPPNFINESEKLGQALAASNSSGSVPEREAKSTKNT